MRDGMTTRERWLAAMNFNAALWLRPAEAIIAELERDLAALPHWRGLIPSSGGMMPPAATPETIKTVADWIKKLNPVAAA